MKIMNWLRVRLIQKSVRQQFALHEKRKAQKPKMIQKIMVLLNSNSSISASTIERDLRQNGFDKASISVVAFEANMTASNEQSDLSFGPGDFSLLGTPLSTVESYINKPYDLLINYFKEDHPYLQLVSLKAKADFRVGFPQVDNRLNDLMFHVPETDSHLFCKQMNTYLNTINTA